MGPTFPGGSMGLHELKVKISREKEDGEKDQIEKKKKR